MLSNLRPRLVLPFAVAVATGVFVSVASHELNWSGVTTFVVTLAMVAVLALFGTPLMLLPIETYGDRHRRSRPVAETSPSASAARRQWSRLVSVQGDPEMNALFVPRGEFIWRVTATQRMLDAYVDQTWSGHTETDDAHRSARWSAVLIAEQLANGGDDALVDPRTWIVDDSLGPPNDVQVSPAYSFELAANH